ncbi:hypothetical protein [Streptomyces tanashiensis]|uniref:hypothetical protein n=1 Tax=Streptomyces tanashiensis TaxID=67367 RepID=UPI00167C6AC2|nr:hypothetical protein [Streptomyces tanashiensis]GGY33056.1 hypothetical protein GCM10010299_44360 [Streptomyces tanashiensis]
MTRRKGFGPSASTWAVALVLAALTTGCSGTQERVGRQVFLDAATRLAGEPAVRYTAGLGGAALEMSTTRYGTGLGAFSLAGMRLEMLAVDGRAFSRWAQVSASGRPAGTPGQLLPEAAQWTTATTPNSPPPFLLTPYDLGAMAAEALRQPGTVFPDHRETTLVDGVATWKASTPTMDVHVTRGTPHRLVRLTPRSSAGLPTPPALPTLPVLPSIPSSPPGPASPAPLPPAMPELPDLQLPDPPAGTVGRSIARSQPSVPMGRAIPLPKPPPRPTLPGRTTIAPLNSRQVGALSQAVARSTGQLSQAVNSAYQFTVRGTGAFSGCGPTACTVTVRVSSSFVTQGSGTPRNVRVRMRAEMTGSGSPVGSCTAAGTLPVNGTGSVSCTNTSSAWASWYRGAELSEGAEPYQAIAHVVAQALDPGEVTGIRDQVDNQFRNLRRELDGKKNCRRTLASAPLRHAVYIAHAPLGPWDDYCTYVLPSAIEETPAFDRRSLEMVRSYHFPGGEFADDAKGLFKDTVTDGQLHKILDRGLGDPASFTKNSQGYYEKTFPSPGVGYDAKVNGGKDAEFVTLVINTAGDVVTMFPHN